MIRRFTIRDTNIVKGFAILFMYVHHFYLSPDRYNKFEVLFPFLGESRVNGIAVFLKICVALFMFLSGYGMYESMNKQNKSWKNVVKYSFIRYFKLVLSFMFIFWLVELVCFPTGRWYKIYGGNIPGLGYFMIDMFGLAKLFGTPTFIGTWWYISLISMIIWTFPFLYKGFQKYPILFLIIICLPCFLTPYENFDYFRWLPTFMLGMVIAKYDYLTKFAKWYDNQKKGTKISTAVVMTILVFLCYWFRKWTFIPIALRDALISFYYCLYIFIYFCKQNWFSYGMEKIGIHSMTMFLTHTLIRETYFKSFSYGFKYGVLNLIIFTFVTYWLAFVIDWIRKKSGYDRWLNEKTRKMKGIV